MQCLNAGFFCKQKCLSKKAALWYCHTGGEFQDVQFCAPFLGAGLRISTGCWFVGGWHPVTFSARLSIPLNSAFRLNPFSFSCHGRMRI